MSDKITVGMFACTVRTVNSKSFERFRTVLQTPAHLITDPTIQGTM
jgi:hypothetical protein